jgi:long-chain fatty acid transport protein
MMNRKPLASAIGLFSLLLASQVHAGGLWISEYGQPTMGRAAAGEEAGTDTADTALFNAAAMSRIDKSELTVTAGAALPVVEFDVDQGSALNGSGDGGDAGGLAPIGSVYYVHPINEKWTVGGSLVGLTGATMDYNDDWAGRFQAQEVSIIVVGLVPSVAYKVSDKFSVGLSVPIMYSKLELDIAVPNQANPLTGPEGKAQVDGDDVKVAATLSFLYEFNESTRLGGRATSKFDFEYGGDLETQHLGAVGIDTEVTMASIVRIGIAHDINEQWSAYATVGMDNWSEMKNVVLSTSSGGVSLPRNWEDTYHYGIGADYRMDKHWTLRAGVAYDTDPTRAKDRTADMPLDEQKRYAIGADYLRDSGMTISGSLVYADYGDAAIDSARLPPLVGYKGEYKTNEIWFASVAFNWPFGGASR